MKRLLPLLLIPYVAFAHPGDHSTTGLLHMLTEPDHLALLAVIVAAAVFGILKLRARR